MLPISALLLNVYDPLQELPFVPRPSLRRDHCLDFELVFTELLCQLDQVQGVWYRVWSVVQMVERVTLSSVTVLGTINDPDSSRVSKVAVLLVSNLGVMWEIFCNSSSSTVVCTVN